MNKKDTALFSIYRFQLLPSTTQLQFSLFENKYSSIEELKQKKNIFFAEALLDEKLKYRGRGYNVLNKIEYSKGDDIILRFGVEKSKEVHKADFKRDLIKDYPNVFVYVNNDPGKQLILIQHDTDAFSDTETVKNFMLDALSRRMANSYNLSLYIEQTFEKNEFWETIAKYEGRITYLKFQFIRENLADIARVAVGQLKQLQNNMNGHEMDLAFKAPKNGVIENLTPDNEQVSDLLSYQMEGGGPAPVIRVKKIKGLIKTANSEKTFEVEDFEGSSEDLSKLVKQLKKK